MITTLEGTRQVGEEPVEQPVTGLTPDKKAALERLVEKRDQLDPERRALVESLAEQHGIPMAPMKGFTQLANPRKEQMSDFGESAKVAALPMAGQLAGGVLGAALGGVPGEMIGQSAGGVGGLMLNRMLGISKPDSLDMALTGAAPVAGKLLTIAGRKAIPGHAAAEQQIGAELIRETPHLLPGSAASTKAAYDVVEAMGSPTMPVPNLQGTVDKMINVESIAKKYGGSNPTIRRAVMDAGKTLQASGGQMPFQDVAIMLKRYREKVSGLEEKGGEALGAYKALRKALFDDMAQAEQQATAAGQNVTALRQAMAKAKESIAKDEYSEILDKYGTKMKTVGGQTFEVIEPTNVLNKLRAIGFEESVGTKQYKAIESTLKELAKIPKPDMETGAGIGTTKRAMIMVGAGALGAFKGPLGSLGGSIAAAATLQAHDAVASLMMSDKGRNFLVKMFKANRGRMGERTGQMLQFAASQFQDTGE